MFFNIFLSERIAKEGPNIARFSSCTFPKLAKKVYLGGPLISGGRRRRGEVRCSSGGNLNFSHLARLLCGS